MKILKKAILSTLAVVTLIPLVLTNLDTNKVSAASSELMKVGRTVSGDFNGDGKADFATMYYYGDSQADMRIISFISNGSSFKHSFWYQSPKNSFSVGRVNGRMVAGDFNGDGKDDIAVMYDDTGSGRATDMRIINFISNGTAFAAKTAYESPTGNFPASRVTGRMVAGDFNGDGKDDIATMYDDSGTGRASDMRIFNFISNGTTFAVKTAFEVAAGNFPVSRVTGRMVAGDFNGDGKDDIATMYDDSGTGRATDMRIINFISNGTTFVDKKAFEVAAGNFPVSQVSERMVAGDFNGDGKDDISVMYDDNNTGRASAMRLINFISNGTTFVDKKGFESPKGSFDAKSVDGKIVAGDITGDGKDDIVTMYDYGSQKMSAISFLSTGAVFSAVDWSAWQAGTFNSDNVTNYVQADGKLTTGWGYIDNQWYYFNNEGVKLKDWQQVNGAWYYLDLSDGHMLTGWLTWNNHWYYLYSNGSMATGWVEWNSNLYYMESNGVMRDSTFVENGVTFTVQANGIVTSINKPVEVKTSFLWPTTNVHSISSLFGYRIYSDGSRFHYGIDISASSNTNVLAAMEGIAKTGYQPDGAGNYINIDHPNGYRTVYMHLNSFKVATTQTVNKGDIIALSGNTGGSTGPHLHFQIQRTSDKITSINPLNKYQADDYRYSATNPNPVFILQNGKYVFNEKFDWKFNDGHYTKTGDACRK